MSGPSERFKKYLSERPVAETVEALSTHHTTLWRIANSLRRPGLELAFAIEALTRRWPGGQIRATEWVDAPVKAARRVAPATRIASPPPAVRQLRRTGGAR